MMRRVRASAACPHIATRTRVTGFNLFTQETQRQRKVLNSKNLVEGRKNMRVMSGMWHELTQRRRDMYNERARQRNVLQITDLTKKNNNFNLLMRLFGAEKLLQGVGDEAFMSNIAKNTMHAMKAKDTKRLRAKMQIKDTPAARGGAPKASRCSFFRFANPHMMFFDSFTEMQRSVAPTRQSAFAAVSKLVSLCHVSASGEEYVVNKFAELTTEESHLFAPISDMEAGYFEIFCATRCGGLDYKHFNILQLFMAFRGIDVDVTHDLPREQVYRSLLGSDRSHDGAYYRSRRCLERLETLRSSDCGVYIAKRAAGSANVPASAYGIESSWDDVAVATMLAETRHQQSVYDDILVRAALLRSSEGNARLDMYHVRLAEAAEEPTAAATRAKKRASVEEVVAEDVEEAAEKEEEEVEEVANTYKAVRAERAKKASPRAADAVTAVPKRAVVKQQSKPVLETKRVARTAKAVPAKTSAPARRSSRTRSVASTNAVAKTYAAEDAEAAEDVDVPADVAVKPRSMRAKRSKAPPSKSPAADEDDTFGVEDFLAAEDAEEYGSEDIETAAPNVVQSAEDDVVVAAPAVKSKKVASRSARSHLTDPATMLPAKARVQKLISKHAAARHTTLPVTTSQPSPYIPPGRNSSFTESIRALLSGSM